VQGEAEHYFLPIYNVRTIYPKYYSLPSCYKLIQQAYIATVQKVDHN